MISTPEQMKLYLEDLLKQGAVTLFAGAGVGAQAGLPDWLTYLNGLSEVLKKYEPTAVPLMQARIAREEFPEAAHVYKDCTQIPDGEKIAQLGIPFGRNHYDASRLACLVSLPFSAIVTTNYDYSLHDAWAAKHSKAPQCVESSEADLRAALFYEDPFIARIHGKAEVPGTIILETDDYKKLQKNEAYIDFVKKIFTQRTCLFVGFSFLDPAIRGVLLTLRESVGSYPRTHHALLAAGSDKLRTELAKFNIAVKFYETTNKHEVLWKGLCLVTPPLQASEVESEVRDASHYGVAKKLLAVCYTRSSMGIEATPLKAVVMQGVLLSRLAEGPASNDDLAEALRAVVAVRDAEAKKIVEQEAGALVRRGLVLRDEEGKLYATKEISTPENLSALDRLVKGVSTRLYVRDKRNITEPQATALRQILQDVILTRGWELGAAFAGAKTDTEIDLLPTLDTSLKQRLPNDWQDRRVQIAEACQDLFRRPDEEEQKILAELGRVAFGVELILQSGRSALYSLSLPQQIFLDANILLPLLATGHPHAKTYANAIKKLQGAAKKAGGEVSVSISELFLNEVLYHRQRALQLAKELNLDDENALKRHILFFGADRTNVFIGAFATERQLSGQNFESYISQVAPFSTKPEAEEFLRKIGIDVVAAKPKNSEEQALLFSLEQNLEAAYDSKYTAYEKPVILVKDEAAQLLLLDRNIKNRIRTIFVTADRRLQKITLDKRFGKIRDLIITNLGLLQLVDLLIGIDVDANSLSRIFWSVRALEEEAIIKNFLIDVAVRQYDAALLMAMGDVLAETARRAAHEAELEDVKLKQTDMQDADVKKTAKFMDRITGEFFASMEEEMKKQKSQ